MAENFRLFGTLILISFVIGIDAELITNCNEIIGEDVVADIAGYADDVDRIIRAFNTDYKGETWKRISDFVDEFGHRLTGTESLENSIDYMRNLSSVFELENIQLENVDVTYWSRGDESATILSPREKNMPMLGLGFSVGAESITALGIVVRTFEELDTLRDDQVRGRIVIYDEPFTQYSQTVKYRREGADRASAKGAVAALVRSVTQFSIASPHTGNQQYNGLVPRIPVAAITHEDADFLRREQERGSPIVINLKMPSTSESKVSRNLIADLPGQTNPDEIVIISGHIDSWDVGDGSMDDAGGCFISWLAPVVLKRMNMIPKRTLRCVLFTSEEQGLTGAQRHKDNNKAIYDDKLAFLMESDFGTFAPLGLAYEGSQEGQCVMQEILKLFTSINATELVLESPAPDISLWTREGFPGAGLHNANDRYFWFHHAEGDTLNVLDSDTMDLNSAFWTSVAYIISDMDYRIPKKV